MIKKVYLIWQHYHTGEYLLIANLTKESNNKYIFKYTKDAIKAMNLGCFLPIPIKDYNNIEQDLVFNSLPLFFSQRILIASKYIINKFEMNNIPQDELSILTYDYGRRNSDNFYIIDELTYQKELQGLKKLLKH